MGYACKNTERLISPIIHTTLSPFLKRQLILNTNSFLRFLHSTLWHIAIFCFLNHIKWNFQFLRPLNLGNKINGVNFFRSNLFLFKQQGIKTFQENADNDKQSYQQIHLLTIFTALQIRREFKFSYFLLRIIFTQVFIHILITFNAMNLNVLEDDHDLKMKIPLLIIMM